MRLGVVSFCVLLAFWLVLSGYFTTFLVLSGVGSGVAVVLLARRMEVVDREGIPLEYWRAVFSYWPWLAWAGASTPTSPDMMGFWTLRRVQRSPAPSPPISAAQRTAA